MAPQLVAVEKDDYRTFEELQVVKSSGANGWMKSHVALAALGVFVVLAASLAVFGGVAPQDVKEYVHVKETDPVCLNGGSNIKVMDEDLCECPPEYYGDLCQEIYDDCNPTNNCGNGSIACMDTLRHTINVTANTCMCSDGFITLGGDDPTCFKQVECPINSAGSYVHTGCTCNTGYHGEPDIYATKISPYYAGVCVEDPCVTPLFGVGIASMEFYPPPPGTSLQLQFGTTLRPSSPLNLTYQDGPKVVIHGTFSDISPMYGYGSCVSPGQCENSVWSTAASCEINTCLRPDDTNYTVSESDVTMPFFEVHASCAQYYVARGVNGYDPDGPVTSTVCETDGLEYSLHGCFSDADQDLYADMDEDCPHDPLKTEVGKCGCGNIDYDEGFVGQLNCPDTDLFAPDDPLFYTVDHALTVNGQTRVKFVDSISISGEAFNTSHTRSTVAGTGRIQSMLFVVNHNTIEFAVAGGGHVKVALYTNWDFETSTGDMAFEYSPTGEVEPRQVQWDVSVLHNEEVVLVVTDDDEHNYIYFNNVVLYDNGGIGCLAECLTITEEPVGGALSIMNESFYPVNFPKEDRLGLYCAANNAPLTSGFLDAKMITAHFAIKYLPKCMMIEKLSDEHYSFALHEGAEEFAFSKMPTAKDSNRFCIYKTETPRCAAIYGSLRNLQQSDMYCKKSEITPRCLETVYDKNCIPGDGIRCGEARTISNMLECCSNDANRPGGTCLGRRRLSENIDNLRISSSSVVGHAVAEQCARKCYLNYDGTVGERGSCIAWRIVVDDFTGEESCDMTQECFGEKSRIVSQGKADKHTWNLLSEVNPFALKRRIVKSDIE